MFVPLTRRERALCPGLVCGARPCDAERGLVAEGPGAPSNFSHHSAVIAKEPKVRHILSGASEGRARLKAAKTAECLAVQQEASGSGIPQMQRRRYSTDKRDSAGATWSLTSEVQDMTPLVQSAILVGESVDEVLFSV